MKRFSIRHATKRCVFHNSLVLDGLISMLRDNYDNLSTLWVLQVFAVQHLQHLALTVGRVSVVSEGSSLCLTLRAPP